MDMVLRNVLAAIIMCTQLSAQTSLSSDEYEKKLAEYQKQDRELREKIAQEQASISDLKNQIDDSRQRIASLQQQQLDFLGITSADLKTASDVINRLENDVTVLLHRADSLFFQDTAVFVGYKNRYKQLLHNPAIKMADLKKKIRVVNDLITQCEKRYSEIPAGPEVEEPPSQVTVVREPDREIYTVSKNNEEPETLYKIAEKVYGDPLQWPRIYQANKSVLDSNYIRYKQYRNSSAYSASSDLIVPGQVLIIPR